MKMLDILFAGIGPFGVQELLIILVIVFFLFGAKKIPDLARGIGRGIKEFKDAAKEPSSKDNEEKKSE